MTLHPKLRSMNEKGSLKWKIWLRTRWRDCRLNAAILPFSPARASSLASVPDSRSSEKHGQLDVINRTRLTQSQYVRNMERGWLNFSKRLSSFRLKYRKKISTERENRLKFEKRRYRGVTKRLRMKVLRLSGDGSPRLITSTADTNAHALISPRWHSSSVRMHCWVPQSHNLAPPSFEQETIFRPRSTMAKSLIAGRHSSSYDG